MLLCSLRLVVYSHRGSRCRRGNRKKHLHRRRRLKIWRWRRWHTPELKKSAELEAACANLKREKENKTTDYWRNIKFFLKRPSGRKQNLRKAMRRSLLNLGGRVWIWRPAATSSTTRVFAASSTNFTKLWLHHLMRFKHGVCSSPTEAWKWKKWLNELPRKWKWYQILFGS
jgi:hypothetical protein